MRQPLDRSRAVLPHLSGGNPAGGGAALDDDRGIEMDKKASGGRGQGRRRRANAAEEKRDLIQAVYVSKTELETLRQRAEAAGVTVPRLLFESAMSDTVETITDRRRQATKLFALHRELSGAAVNMNQVAKKANTVHEVPSEFHPTMLKLRAVADKLEQAVDDLIGRNRTTES
jgi:hypothetical protein